MEKIQNGLFQTLPEARDLMEALMQEVTALAEIQGIDLTSRDIQEWHSFLEVLSPQGKTSMLQDIEAGRKTEVEIFGGKVVAMGRTHPFFAMIAPRRSRMIDSRVGSLLSLYS